MPEFTNAAFLLDALKAAGTSVPLHAWRSLNTLSKWSAAALAAFVVPVVVITAWGTWRLQADALARDVVPGEVFTAGNLWLHAIARAVYFIPEEVIWGKYGRKQWHIILEFIMYIAILAAQKLQQCLAK